MRHFPAIDQLNPRRDGPVPIADQMLRMMRPQLLGPVNHLGPGTKSPQRRSRSGVADYLQFGTPATGSRPQAIHFQRPVRRQLRRGQRRLPQLLADRTLDAAHPVTGAGVTQSLLGQADGDVTVFLENRWWRIPSPSSVMPPAIWRHWPQRNTSICKRTSRSRWQWRGRSDGGDAWPGGNGRRWAGSRPGLVAGRLGVGRGFGVPVRFPGSVAVP